MNICSLTPRYPSCASLISMFCMLCQYKNSETQQGYDEYKMTDHAIFNLDTGSTI